MHPNILAFLSSVGNPPQVASRTAHDYAEVMSETVALARVPGYEPGKLDTAIARVLEASTFNVRPGDRVLVKPNLVTRRNARHCTTDPQVVRAACTWLLDHGAKVTVADSPAFGSASGVAKASGLDRTLKELGLSVRDLKKPVSLPLALGGTIGLSRDALETDSILNAPKLKTHGQMVLSGAVKNLFGCVVGVRKAMAHYKLGHSHEIFRSMLMDVYLALPHTHHIMDAIRPMHGNGPIEGKRFSLGMLGASPCGIALDTAACFVLGLTPGQVPLWEETLHRGMPGAIPGNLDYPLEQPDAFDATGFQPAAWRELSFRPSRIVRGRLRSLRERFEK